MMLVSKMREEDLSPEMIDRILFRNIEDSGECADCIIVLGSIKASKYRVPVAVEAYKAGRSARIILCGGNVRDFSSGTCSEAEHMRRAAVESGVAEEHILMENASQNTVENILFAMDVLQQAFGLNNVHNILLVTTTYHMRRSLAIARHLLPKHINVIPCPADDNNTKRNNWMNTSAGTSRAKGEALKIISFVINGDIPDFEV